MKLSPSAWLAVFTAVVLTLSSSCAQKPLTHAEEPQVRTFLKKYFDTWSTQDMAGYESCFHPQARVYLLDKSGHVMSQGLTDFIHGQKMAHARSPVPMTEKPLDIRILMDEIGAQAYVTWVLTKGNEEERGVDLFTLKNSPSGWQIISLTFYGE